MEDAVRGDWRIAKEKTIAGGAFRRRPHVIARSSVFGPLPLAGVDFIATRETAGSGFRRFRGLLKDMVGFATLVKAAA